MPSVVHISPVMFGADGYWGGGERYPLELARAQADLVPTRLVSFGRRARRMRLGALEIHVLPIRGRLRGDPLNPISELLPFELLSASVIHLHQTPTALSDAVTLLATGLRKPVFVTDLGASATSLRRIYDTRRLVRGHLAVSRFAAQMNPVLANRTTVIYGGADLERFSPAPSSRRRVVVFVGRVLPHKGIHDLVDALDPDMPLEIYGRTYDTAYRQALEAKAAGKDVRFFDAASDDAIVEAYRSARAVVLPSVHDNTFSGPAPKAELLGLTLIEAMACATPVIASSAASLPEVVDHGSAGLLFRAGSVAGLRQQLRRLWDDNDLWKRMSGAGLSRVHSEFTWNRTAVRALRAYDEAR